MIQSVRRATAILLELGSGQRRLGVTELSDRLGLAKATVYGLLRALEADEMVQRDVESGKYRLGPVLLQLGNAFLEGHELRARSMLWADSLADRTEQAVRVGIPMGSSILIVHHVFRPDTSVQTLEVGATIPWHACALGKVMAAFRDDAELEQKLAGPLPRLTGRTLVDRRGARTRAGANPSGRRRHRGPGGHHRRGRDRRRGRRSRGTPWAPLGSSVRSNGFWWTASRGPIWPAPSSRWPRGLSRDMAGARVYERGR